MSLSVRLIHLLPVLTICALIPPPTLLAQDGATARAAVSESIEGGSDPAVSRGDFSVPRYRKSLLLSWSIDFVDWSQGNDPNLSDAQYELKVLSPAGVVLYSRSETVNALSVQSWGIIPAVDTSGWWHYRKFTNTLVDVSAHTQASAGRFAVEVSISAPSGYGTASVLSGTLYTPRAEDLHFDFEAAPSDGSASGDGVTLRIDAVSTVAKPEYDRRARYKPATLNAFTVTTVGPAAYVANKPLRFKARFSGLPNSCRTARVRGVIKEGTGSEDSQYGSIPETTVLFTRGVSAPVTFSSTLAASTLDAADLRIEWEFVSLTWDPDETDIGGTMPTPGYRSDGTTHRIYTIYKNPVAPMQTPWAKALEISSRLLRPRSVTAAERNLVRDLAQGVFRSEWLAAGGGPSGNWRFYRPTAKYVYNPMSQLTCGANQTIQQQFLLTTALNRLSLAGDAELQCSDSSNLLRVLAAVQGITVTNRYFTGKGLAGEPINLPSTNIVQGAGQYACRSFTNLFFHQLPFVSGVFDASFQKAHSDATAGCVADGNYFGFSWGEYLGSAFSLGPASILSFEPGLELSELASCPIN